ncbi:MAG: ABC transporter permease [Clostridia bacterium]|nr:ABC transporter permease [Clostridia bacterium]
MDIKKRLFRRPLTTVLWLIMVIIMTVFFTVGGSLWYSSARLAQTLDKSHTAIAVRSDPGIVNTTVYHGVKIEETEQRTFTQADVDALRAMPSVKEVRSHTLTAGTSESFLPILDINKYRSWTRDSKTDAYNDITICGKVKRIVRAPSYIFCEAEVIEVLLYDPEFEDAVKSLKNYGWFQIRSYAPETEGVWECPESQYIEYGKNYVFSGTLEMGMPMTLDLGYSTLIDGMLMAQKIDTAAYRIAIDKWEEGAPQPAHEDSYYEQHPDETPEPPDPEWVAMHPKIEDYLSSEYLPAVARMYGSPNLFFDSTANDIWREYRDSWERQHHSLPLIGTDKLESFFAFQSGNALIIDGRSFTEEEYSSGARSIIISERTAKRSGLSVGDKVMMSQYSLIDPDADEDETKEYTSKLYNNPDIAMLSLNVESGPEEEFTVVGIYRLNVSWAEGSFSITPNTAFIPRAAQGEGAFGVIPAVSDAKSGDIYGVYLSVELKNGSVDDFRLEIADSPYAGQFFPYDQGYEAVQKNINGLASSSLKLSLLAAIGWALFLLLFLLMYQAAQKNNLGVMRSVGAKPKKALSYLFWSGLIVAAVGILIGTLISSLILKTVQNRIIGDSLASIDRTAYGGTLIISEEALAQMVRASTPGAVHLAVFALAQLALIALLIFIQAKALSGRRPRALLS